ncbi:MAG: large conductance mechanosensitive channel protein MscL [Planctomycetaceae bacterium]|nr:large conductance mechanosensitive channel protein MscL [Planctomycetaceae bacterium]
MPIDPLKLGLPFDPASQARTLFGEFKNFAFKGNVIDLAVGVIIGGAFGKIVDSLVKNIVMPFVAVVLPGDQEYAKWSLTLNGKPVPYGLFIADVVNFLILAAVLFFFIVKFLGWLMRVRKAEAIAPPAPPAQELLLTEIRDLLKHQVSGTQPLS